MHKPLLARASILSRDLGQLGRREAKFPSSHHGSDAEAAREGEGEGGLKLLLER